MNRRGRRSEAGTDRLLQDSTVEASLGNQGRHSVVPCSQSMNRQALSCRQLSRPRLAFWRSRFTPSNLTRSIGGLIFEPQSQALKGPMRYYTMTSSHFLMTTHQLGPPFLFALEFERSSSPRQQQVPYHKCSINASHMKQLIACCLTHHGCRRCAGYTSTMRAL